MKKTTLAIDVRSYEARGIGRYLQLITPDILKSRQFRVVLIGPDKFKGYQEFQGADEYIVHNVKTFALRDLFNYPRLRDVDVLWVPNIHVPWFLWFFKQKKVKKIITVHDVNPLSLTVNNYSYLKRNILRFYYYFAMKYAARVITGSEFSYGEILHFFPFVEKKLTIVKYGFMPIVENHLKNGAKDHLKSDFFVVSSYRNHKNIDRLLRVFMRLSNEYPKKKFCLAGTEVNQLPLDLQGQLKNYRDKIHIMGFVDEETLHNLYRKTSAVVVSSLYEGFGYPVLEAVYYNKPVYCSDIAPFREIMGSNAFLFDPLDDDNIYSVLKTGLSSKITPDSKKYEQIKNRFTKERMVREHIELFREEKL